MSGYRTKPKLNIDVLRIGQSQEPVIVIDNFLEAPDFLIEAAKSSTDWRDLAPGGYPGRRAGLPKEYVRAVMARLDGLIQRRLFGERVKFEGFECSFSMVTKLPDALTASQQVPHIDVADEHRVAILHYLSSRDLGGTAFFRQDATGLELVRAQDRDPYLRASKLAMNALGDAAKFPDETTKGYTQIGQVEAKFNRLIAYRSCLIHSGVIKDPNALSNDPSNGRLTANIFARYEPPKK